MVCMLNSKDGLKKNHIAKNCYKSIKCFKCNGLGHKANQCEAKVGNSENKRETSNVQQVFDLGSDICTVSYKIFKNLDVTSLKQEYSL